MPRQMVPGKARDAGNGHSLTKSRNTAWHHLPRNPKGRGPFGAALRFSELIWNTKLRSSCLVLHQTDLRRDRDEASADPLHARWRHCPVLRLPMATG
ncbi:hypothetical protein PSEUDO8BK_40324 [Pseudomonas sp. 8BK]|nr:hypothetical protein PSEUDO8BK_40324 [Pseudomonas sp. 8BK]